MNKKKNFTNFSGIYYNKMDIKTYKTTIFQSDKAKDYKKILNLNLDNFFN